MKKLDKYGKVDKGFEILYNNLSSRRNFIKKIWISIIGILIFMIYFVTREDKTRLFVFFIIFAIVVLIQLTYTYRTYKREKQDT